MHDPYGWEFERAYRRRARARLIPARGWTYIAILAGATMLGFLVVGVYPAQALAVWHLITGGA